MVKQLEKEEMESQLSRNGAFAQMLSPLQFPLVGPTTSNYMLLQGYIDNQANGQRIKQRETCRLTKVDNLESKESVTWSGTYTMGQYQLTKKKDKDIETQKLLLEFKITIQCKPVAEDQLV